VINALTVVGKFDVKTLAEGLHSDKWYVVRNIIVVLGKIADSWSLEYLTKTLTHPDPRVRKEVIKTLAGIGGANVLRHFKNALNDDILSVRITAAREMGNIKTETAKNILLTELAKKDFLLKDFTEKKEFYEAVAHWDDPQVRDFLRTALKKRKFWKKIKNDETRACAAYALGIIGDKESVPYLEKAKHSKNKLLNAFASAALRRLTN
jgi:HEAT repeat protein